MLLSVLNIWKTSPVKRVCDRVKGTLYSLGKGTLLLIFGQAYQNDPRASELKSYETEYFFILFMIDCHHVIMPSW